MHISVYGARGRIRTREYGSDMGSSAEGKNLTEESRRGSEGEETTQRRCGGGGCGGGLGRMRRTGMDLGREERRKRGRGGVGWVFPLSNSPLIYIPTSVCVEYLDMHSSRTKFPC